MWQVVACVKYSLPQHLLVTRVSPYSLIECLHGKMTAELLVHHSCDGPLDKNVFGNSPGYTVITLEYHVTSQ